MLVPENLHRVSVSTAYNRQCQVTLLLSDEKPSVLGYPQLRGLTQPLSVTGQVFLLKPFPVSEGFSPKKKPLPAT